MIEVRLILATIRKGPFEHDEDPQHAPEHAAAPALTA
jgi:cytochrome d ubiquinol oxidase subunit I